MKKVLLFGLCAVLLLTGCGKSDTSTLEGAKKSKNSVICTQTKELDYRDIDALREQANGTFEEGLKEASKDEYDEIQRKRNIKVGTYTQENIVVFNEEGTQIEKIYVTINNTFTHEDATDELLKANKDYLDNYYKTSDDYTSYKVTIDGKSVIRELTYNMAKMNKESLKMTKQELIYKATISSEDGKNKTVCVAN